MQPVVTCFDRKIIVDKVPNPHPEVQSIIGSYSFIVGIHYRIYNVFYLSGGSFSVVINSFGTQVRIEVKPDTTV